MALLCVSNNPQITDRIIDNKKSYYPNHKTFPAPFAGAVFEKRSKSLGNYYSEDNGFAAIVGSFIYKNAAGIDAVKLIFSDFSEEKISYLKKSIIGYYSAFVYKDGKAFCFNDYYGIYDTYYACANGWIIATSFEDACSIIANPVIDEYPFVMEMFEGGCFLSDTPIKEVKKLLGRDYIQLTGDGISLKSIPISEYKIKYEYKGERQAIRDLCELLEYYARLINNVFQRGAVFMTGGLDSRLVLAAFKKVNANIQCVYGHGGKGVLSDMQVQDQTIVRDICASYNIPLQVLNWEHQEDSSDVDWKYQDELFNQVGVYNRIVAGNVNIYNWIEILGKDCFLNFGYFCEAIRLREWAEDQGVNVIPLEHYVNSYYINKSLTKEVYPRIDEFKSFITSIFSKLLIENGISNGREIPIDSFERFRWIQARYIDSRMDMRNNFSSYSFPLLSIPVIHELILSLPAEIIKHGKFQIKTIKSLDEGLATKFNVFSHRREYKINSKGEKIPVINLKNVISRLLTMMPFLKPIVHLLYRKAKYENFSEASKSISRQVEISKGDVSWPLNISNYYSSDIASYYHFRQCLFAYKNILTRK